MYTGVGLKVGEQVYNMYMWGVGYRCSCRCCGAAGEVKGLLVYR